MSGDFTEIVVEELGNGDAISQVNEHLKLAIENILDINKDPTLVREVSLKIKFKPLKGREREEYVVEFQASSKLPPDAAGQHAMVLAKGKGYLPKMKQLTFEESYDPVSGEVLDEGENVTKLDPAKAEGDN
jgi:hypothetical protein